MTAILSVIGAIRAGVMRVSLPHLAWAAALALVTVVAVVTAARLMDGAVADYRLRAEQARTAAQKAVDAAAAKERAIAEDIEATRQRAAELERELAAFTDGDPVVLPRTLVRRLNQ